MKPQPEQPLSCRLAAAGLWACSYSTTTDLPRLIQSTPDGILGDVGQVEACFSLLGDSVNLGVT
jgi:hypothetical protein